MFARRSGKEKVARSNELKRFQLKHIETSDCLWSYLDNDLLDFFWLWNCYRSLDGGTDMAYRCLCGLPCVLNILLSTKTRGSSSDTWCCRSHPTRWALNYRGRLPESADRWDWKNSRLRVRFDPKANLDSQIRHHFDSHSILRRC